MDLQQKLEFTILLVDDRPENLISLEEILLKENRKFIIANSGNEALKAVLKNENIGLIMLDVQMPEMDGFEVAKILKSNPKTKDVSIIFVTAINKDEQYVMKGFEEGAVDYLSKPLDVNVVRAKVNVFEQLYFHQQSLKATSTELEKINKQLERFVYVVSHDLKSPLSSIIMMLDIIQGNSIISDQPDLKKNIEMLSGAATHLSNMVTSILDYSRKSSAQQTIEKVDTKDLVEQISSLFFLHSNIQVTATKSLPVIQTRKQKLQQVLQNLMSNSIKYIDKPQGFIEVGAVEKGGMYEFYVKDNGPGIAAKDKERIFQLFETTDNKSSQDSSTGIGLNLLKVLVEEQGGKIWVQSVPGEGSTFYFEWRK